MRHQHVETYSYVSKTGHSRLFSTKKKTLYTIGTIHRYYFFLSGFSPGVNFFIVFLKG
jgi:hypothetical protein